jgi:hypothetical protein
MTGSSKTHLVPATAAAALVICCGLVHGVWTERWARRNLPDVADRLERVPLHLEGWEGKRLTVDDPRGLGAVAGCFYGRYVDATLGHAVQVFLVGGPPGPVAVHTPDVCYAASGFEVLSQTRFQAPLAAGEFWSSNLLRIKSSDHEQLRIFWSWNAGAGWSVPESPRLAFARSPVLYKLYLIRETSGDEGRLEEDPCVALMRHLLPELQKLLGAQA